MGCELMPNRNEFTFGHLQGKHVVRDMPLTFGVEIVRQPLAACIGHTSDRGGLAFGERLDFGIALHLAFQALCDHCLVRGLEQCLIDRLLLPVVAVGELLDRMPTGKDIPGEMVMRVDEAGRNDAMSVDDRFIRRKLNMGSDGDDLALRNEDGSVLDDAVRGNDGAAERIACSRLLRP